MKNMINNKLFYKLLLVQIMIAAMGSINSLIDGIIAGRFIDAMTVGVIGLFFPIVFIMNAISAVISGGSAVLSGRYIGSGDLKKTNGIFSLSIAITVLVSFFLVAAAVFFPGLIARFCGAEDSLIQPLKLYILGNAIGFLPQLLSQQLASFLQLERQSQRNYIGIATMIVSNVTFNILFVVVFKMGVFGLALSTSMCNWLYLLVLLPYYFQKNSQLKFSTGNIFWEKLGELLKIGIPGAFILFCLSLREPVLNRIVIRYAGPDGISAKAALSMIGGIFTSVCLGAGAVVRMLSSIYRGEEDRDSLKSLLKLCYTKIMILALVTAGFMMLVSGLIAEWYFPDRSSEVYKLAYDYFILYAVATPFIMIVQIENNYLQAMGHNICVNVISFMDGFANVVCLAFLLAPLFGVIGIWWATPLGSLLSSLIYPIYAIICKRGIPANANEWMILEKDFGSEDNDRLIMLLSDMTEVTETAEKVQSFCSSHGLSKKTAMYSALCLEEMTRNVVEFGFEDNKRKYYLNSRIVYKKGEVLLRIKDDCKAFDPVDMYKRLNAEDPAMNIGIKMVMRIAEDVSYQNFLGLNVLTIGLKEA
ncbi:MAG: ATP-binding protein [Lachnospiraceae bacterium]|nr:ATP-binding protein [Lachnospiraceae bacterium]